MGRTDDFTSGIRGQIRTCWGHPFGGGGIGHLPCNAGPGMVDALQAPRKIRPDLRGCVFARCRGADSPASQLQCIR